MRADDLRFDVDGVLGDVTVAVLELAPEGPALPDEPEGLSKDHGSRCEPKGDGTFGLLAAEAEGEYTPRFELLPKMELLEFPSPRSSTTSFESGSSSPKLALNAVGRLRRDML